jgi:hypothetical protein
MKALKSVILSMTDEIKERIDFELNVMPIRVILAIF